MILAYTPPKTCYNSQFTFAQDFIYPFIYPILNHRMKLAVIGVNHKTAPVAIRERLSFGSDLPTAINSLRQQLNAHGALIVSTCNRSEIYVGFDEAPNCDDGLSQSCQQIHQWLADFKALPLVEIAPFLYTYEDNRALNHWLRVASGLDSMILGEPQILGQIRQAVASAKEAGGIGSEFDWLTQQVFAAARSVRRDSKVGEQAVTLGFATSKLVTQIFDQPSQTTLLIVAAGEMNRLVAHNVASLGMNHIIIANRSCERAIKLKNELIDMANHAGRHVDIECVGLDKLAEVLPRADVVSSCSGSMEVLITADMVKTAQKTRRHQPLLLVDLAVPRDIETKAGELDDVYLYSVDDLQHVIAGNLEERKQAAVEAELLVSQLTLNIESQMQLLSARKLISNYRQTAQAHQQRLLQLANKRLDSGVDARTVLGEFAHALTQTLTHPPSKLIRQIAQTSDPATLEMVIDGLDSYRKK